jgi:hypothetical protein
MLFRQPIILTITMLCMYSAYAQVGVSEAGNGLITKATFTQTDSGVFITQPSIGKCRQKIETGFFIPNPTVDVVLERKRMEPIIAKEKFLTVHGNITYFFNYRSYIDTPFAENNVMQHAVQTRLDLKLKDKYPFTVYLTSRSSNSAYFSNATDVSFQFHKEQMLEDIKKDMRADADKILYNKALSLTPAQLYQREKDGTIKDVGNFSNFNVKEKLSKLAAEKQQEIQQQVTKLYNEYKEKVQKLETLKAASNRVSEAQALVEEKEKTIRGNSINTIDSIENIATVYQHKATALYSNKIDSTLKMAQDIVADKEKLLRNKTDNLKDTVNKTVATYKENLIGKQEKKADSVISAISKKINEKRQGIEKAQKEVAQSEQALKQYQKKVTDSLQKVKRLIAIITDKNSLNEYLQKTGSSVKALPKLQRILLAVKQIGLGRSWIDYSELTVKNISLTGFNIEMNPGNIYFAAAAGKVNYRFRDYIVKGNYTGSNQNVGLIRAGYGKKDKNNIIFTYYAGQKALLTQTSPTDAATQKISGFSVETRKKIDEHNYVIAEYARSTSPALQTKILDFNNNTNEAFSVKLFSDYGNTKANGYYRKTGEAFQSFTLFPTNNKQDAWMIRVTQALWKKRILLDAAVRKNDFNGPIAAPSFSNTNVFKSFQVTARIPKYPFVSAGYYPSSQLTLSNNNVLYENRYNTLNAIVSHSYYLGKLSMNSNATFTKFYNSGSDTGFIYYNASTITINHSVNLASFVLQGIVTVTEQSYLKQTTIEPVLTYSLKNKLSVSGSIKWSRVNRAETLWGGTAGLNLYLNRIGVLQIQYDKIYLPGYDRNLLPVDMGRVTFSREF